MVRLLIVDDHPLVRRGIVEVLAEAFPGGTIVEASDEAETLTALFDGTWDLVVLDLSLPGRTGLDVLKEIRSARPGLPVLILSTYPEEQFAARALRGGASGYLNKGTPPEVCVPPSARCWPAEICQCQPGGVARRPSGRDSSKPLHQCLSDREIRRHVAYWLGQVSG